MRPFLRRFLFSFLAASAGLASTAAAESPQTGQFRLVLALPV